MLQRLPSAGVDKEFFCDWNLGHWRSIQEFGRRRSSRSEFRVLHKRFRTKGSLCFLCHLLFKSSSFSSVRKSLLPSVAVPRISPLLVNPGDPNWCPNEAARNRKPKRGRRKNDHCGEPLDLPLGEGEASAFE